MNAYPCSSWRTTTMMAVIACLCAALSSSAGAPSAYAQQAPRVPATDASSQASPIAPRPEAADIDDSVQASPELGPLLNTGGPALAPHTALPIKLKQAIDSSQLKNGQHVAAMLTAPVGRMPAGTPAVLSVVATVPAGELNAAGEFSLQLVAVGRTGVETETQTFRGEPGHKDLPDSAPQLGTNAGLPAGAPLTFHVQPPPAPASGPPANSASSPGSVDGRAIGSQGTPRPAAQANNAGAGSPAGNVSNGQQGAPKGAQSVNPGNTTTHPINSGGSTGSSTGQTQAPR